MSWSAWPALVISSLAFTLGVILGVSTCALAFLIFFRRRSERAQRAERRAVAAERLAELGALTGGLAHEIKNPLSSVVLNAQLLREAVLDAELPKEESQRIVRRVDTLARETARLKDILEDFLRFAGRIQLDRQPCDLRVLIDELSDFVHPQSELTGVLLRSDLPPQPVVANVDAGLLKQAVLNLMLNAMQAMDSVAPPARRELILRVEGQPANPGLPREVSIHVIDTGPGIPEGLREEIFRPYITSKKGGSGLGLAVARRIIEEHGGSIHLFSEVGRGSDFRISLPSTS